jgi:hypothetical protein
MKKIVIFYCFLISMFGGFSTVFAEDVDIRKVIESLNAKWNEAFNSDDITALASLYADSNSRSESRTAPGLTCRSAC